jgi:SAM-dependent methyltransferase
VGSSSTGIRALLARPQLYELWSQVAGAEHGRSTLVRDHVRPDPGARVLDLGCGPGELVRYLGDVEYVGVDINPEYIAQAKRVHGRRAEFRIGDATALDADLRGFDVVVAFGVLHHLDDAAAHRALQNAATALEPSGRVVTVDPVLSPGQPWLARRLILWDRGTNVRSEDGYVRLAETVLADVQTTVRSDLLRLPYTHCILEATRA